MQGRSTYVSQSKVSQIANKLSSCSAESQRITPESPLEGDHRHHAQRLKDHGKCRFATTHAAIEQADTRDNEEHQDAGEVLVDIVELESYVRSVDIDDL